MKNGRVKMSLGHKRESGCRRENALVFVCFSPPDSILIGN